jgi:hypothetical protein
MNIDEVVNMAQPKRAAKELEAAFWEAGVRNAQAMPDFVWLHLGQQHVLEVKAISAGHGRPQEVRNALAHLQLTGPRVLATIVADHFTDGAIEVLRENGVNYLDDCRFVFRLEDPLIAINRDRERRQKPKPRRERGLGGQVGVAVQEILLEGRDWWQVTDLALAAGVAAGTAQTTLQRLQDMDLMTAEGAGPRKRRRVVDRGGLLDRWAQDARSQRNHLVSVYLYAQGPRDLARTVSAMLAEGHIGHAVTGAAAAVFLAPHATEVRTCEVWVDPGIGAELLAVALGAAPVERGGNIVILQDKTQGPLYRAKEVEGVIVANPLRVYADLLEDPKRGQEQAQFLRDTVLGF